MKKFIVILIMITAFCSFASEVRENIVVKGSNIFLGDIVKEIPHKYFYTKVTSTGMPGSIKKVNVAYINQLLTRCKLSIIDPDKYTYIDVKTFEYVITSNMLVDFLIENYGLSMPILLNYNEKKVNTDNVRIIMDMMKNKFIVNIYEKGDQNIKEKLLSKFILYFKERFQRKVLVTNSEIKAGASLSRKYFSFMTVPVPEDIDDIVDEIDNIKYCIASKDLPVGTILLSSMINYADIVIKGSTVSAVQSGDGYFITIKLQAMQDGKYNEIINLKGLDNRRKYRGRVTGENKVELSF